MGVSLHGERIMQVLANANEDAKRHGDQYVEDQNLDFWRATIQALKSDLAPRTYLAITAVLLTARAMHPVEELDVLALKSSTDARGYAASSIGSRLASFAKEQRVDLRANSSQPLNNQPFTFKERILPDMGVQPKFEIPWRIFYAAAERINETTPETAKQALALLFHMCRRVDAVSVSVKVKTGGKSSLEKISAAVGQFVSANVDGGKVGQAFVAALLDLLYGAEQVVLGDTQDPDASTPGDVQVKDVEGVWLWAEAKQKVIGTGDITGFLRQVRKAGGERVVYFALVNSTYSGQIKPEGIDKEAETLGIGVKVVESAEQALDAFLPVAPGSYATVASALLERFRARMVESHVKPTIVSTFDDLASKYAVLE